MAETNSLLNCRIPQGVPGVRIPPSPHTKHDALRIVFCFGVWRSPASAPALGAGGRRFESCCPDNLKTRESRRFVTPFFFWQFPFRIGFILFFTDHSCHFLPMSPNNPYLCVLNDEYPSNMKHTTPWILAEDVSSDLHGILNGVPPGLI